MKIAIATDGDRVSAHFGRCGNYTIFEVNEKEKTIIDRAIIETPEHQPGMLPGFLSSKGAHVVIAGGMGPRAQQLFAQLNIQPIIGVTGTVDDVIECFLDGRLQSGESLCTQGHDGHHECGHH